MGEEHAGAGPGASSTSSPSTSSPARPVAIRTMALGALCAFEDPRRQFYNTGSRLLDLLAEAKIEVEASHSVGPPNWSRETAVFVGMGRQTSGGFAIEVVDARVEPRALVVKVRETRPSPGENVTMSLTSPFHLAVLGARAPVVRFETL